MAEKTPQTYKNHARYDPVFHFFALPVAGATVVIAIYDLVKDIIDRGVNAHAIHAHAIWYVVLALAFVVTVLKCRTNALKAQDRVIRLEERLRLTTLCAEPMRSRIGELKEGQLIALRFASDEEVAGLAAKALSDKMSSAEIKKAIKNWRPDYFRV
jgi:Family of unknown function (DUF6526)